ncbi:MAG: tyrosine-protein phosphatase [Clostridia bacterium]|nr:tyrosine-protein phosphatase [Clostridia bacterium]
MKNRFAAFFLALVFVCAAFVSCGSKTPAPVTDAGLIHEPEFGGVYITLTIDEFNSKGYEYGDSVKVIFSNGYTIDDIPYYNGYYTATGEMLLVAYRGYDYIKAAINNGADLWNVAGLDEDDTADIELVERGKYAKIQNARDISYKDDRELFTSDEEFANFRSVEAGNIKKNYIFRSASPCDDQHKRAKYVNVLAEAAGIETILDLADTDEKIKGYISSEGFSCDWFHSVYDSGNVIPVALNMNFSSDDFRMKIADGFVKMTSKDGPYLIHCTEGKDRTGFVCMLIEALAGATYEEIVSDYMKTYGNYYGITAEKDKERYDVIVESVLEPMIGELVGEKTVDIRTEPLEPFAEAFLHSAGMTEDEIAEFVSKITG